MRRNFLIAILVGSKLIGQPFTGPQYFHSRPSGLDPDITPAAAEYQVAIVAHARNLEDVAVQAAVQRHTYQRQFGFLGEAHVNVLELNRDLDQLNRSTN